MAKGTWQGSGTWKTTSGGGGGLALVVIVAVVLIGSGAASAAASAVASLLVTLAIVLGALIGLAVLGGIGFLVWRARQDRPGRPIAARLMYPYPVPPAVAPHLEGAGRPAVEAPRNELHLHFHGMTPADAAEAIRTAIPGTAGDAGGE